MTTKLGSIQYLRAVAALLVVLHHALVSARGVNQPFGEFDVGQAGVDVFFVISGFVIFGSQQRNSEGLGHFAWRRFVRIAPLYWLFTAILIALHFGIGLMREMTITPEHVIRSALFLPHANPDHPETIRPVLGAGWTLVYEAFFYCLFGLAIVFARARILACLSAMIVVLVGLGLMLGSGPAWVETYTDPLLLEFLAGVLLAAWLRERDLPRYSWLLAPLGVLALIGSTFVEAPRVVEWGIPAFALVVGLVALERHGVEFASRGWLLLGNASYSLYLSHIIVQPIMREVWRRSGVDESTWVGGSAYTALLIGSSLVIGVASYRYLETPLLRMLSRISSSARPRDVGAERHQPEVHRASSEIA